MSASHHSRLREAMITIALLHHAIWYQLSFKLTQGKWIKTGVGGNCMQSCDQDGEGVCNQNSIDMQRTLNSAATLRAKAIEMGWENAATAQYLAGSTSTWNVPRYQYGKYYWFAGYTGTKTVQQYCEQTGGNGWRVCFCTTSSANVGGDPVTWYGNRRVEFHLPVDKPILLLKAPDLLIYGISFQGLTHSDQWIKRIVATTARDKKLVDVHIKQDLASFNRSLLPDNAFETLSVVMWDDQPTPLDFWLPPDAYFYHANVTITFARPNSNPWNIADTLPQRECVLIAAVHLKVIVCSSSAAEYYGEHGRGAHVCAHLDLEIVDMQSHHFLEGVLPEVWGLKSLSDTTRSYIQSISHPSSVPSAAGISRASVDFSDEGSKVTV